MAFLLPLTAFCTAFFLQTAGANGVPALFVFGDSTLDVGNNNYLPRSLAKANYPPYGIDYPHREPTGRFSNGYNTADFLAMKLSFKESPKAFFSITSEVEMSEGLNFASGASGILDSTNQNHSVPLNTQIRHFEGVASRLKIRMGHADLFFSKSLFVFVAGTNDLSVFCSNTKLQNVNRSDQLVTPLASKFITQLETLYNLGARKFIVFGSSLLGCSPLVRLNNPSGNCVEDLNEISYKLSKAMEFRLRNLASTSKGLSYVFVDMYELYSQVILSPFKYGFTEIKSACCGAGKFNGESPCSPEVTYCPNREEHLFWDRSHISQAAHKLYADVAYSGGRKLSRPMNIQQLVEC